MENKSKLAKNSELTRLINTYNRIIIKNKDYNYADCQLCKYKMNGAIHQLLKQQWDLCCSDLIQHRMSLVILINVLSYLFNRTYQRIERYNELIYSL